MMTKIAQIEGEPIMGYHIHLFKKGDEVIVKMKDASFDGKVERVLPAGIYKVRKIADGKVAYPLAMEMELKKGSARHGKHLQT